MFEMLDFVCTIKILIDQEEPQNIIQIQDDDKEETENDINDVDNNQTINTSTSSVSNYS